MQDKVSSYIDYKNWFLTSNFKCKWMLFFCCCFWTHGEQVQVQIYAHSHKSKINLVVLFLVLAVGNCGNSSSLCPDAKVELYCQTSGQILIWNVAGFEFDFHVKDSVGATESFGGFTAELTGRNGGTQSRLQFRMETSLNGTVAECLDALGSITSCLVQLTGVLCYWHKQSNDLSV